MATFKAILALSGIYMTIAAATVVGFYGAYAACEAISNKYQEYKEAQK